MHVAVVKDTVSNAPRRQYRIYIDGVLRSSLDDLNPNEPDASLQWTISGRDGYTFTGLIDEVRLTQRALRPEEFLIGTQSRSVNNDDPDGDGVSNCDEVNTYGTDPLVADSDRDGVPDGAEVRAGTDPQDVDSR
jgi:hypothetical protein